MVFTLGFRKVPVLSSDLWVQEDVAAWEALSESQRVGVWVVPHHNLEAALVEEDPSYPDALVDPLGVQRVLWEGHPWVEEAFVVEAVLLVG